jgi:hypothetical protein
MSTPTELDQLFTVTCSCGHQATFFAFTTCLTGDLPPGHFQCPECKRHWEIKQGKITITPWGTCYSEPNKIVFTQSYL